jgi:hypothetical protein
MLPQFIVKILNINFDCSFVEPSAVMPYSEGTSKISKV